MENQVVSTFAEIIKWINFPFLHVGESPVTVMGLFMIVIVLIGAMILSNVVQRLISTSLQKKFNLESGLIYTIQRFVHYAILTFAVVIATQMIGLNLGSLAVIFGFLSVGIGFGLQNVASNFISGLILLLERPVGVGDLIEVEGRTGIVQDVHMRATEVRTLDNTTIIVPNSQLIENQVVNWSKSDKRQRIHCPIGVAYGSDVPKVKDILLNIAKQHTAILADPQPQVYFKEFADSSLNFELLAWIDQPERQDPIKSEINFMIDEEFRKADISIPFPQRDLNLQMTPALKECIR